MIQKQDMATLITDSLVRVGQNMLLALAMLPCMLVGAGLNMGLSIGIVCGIVGGLLSVQFGLTSWIGFFVAAGLAILFGCLGGYIYGKMLNLVKGSEMLIGNFLRGVSDVYVLVRRSLYESHDYLADGRHRCKNHGTGGRLF